MTLRPSYDFHIGQQVTVYDGWGTALFKGDVWEIPSPYSLVVINSAGTPHMVSTSGVREEVGEMSAEKPWEDVPREMMEEALATQAATIARMLGEAESMAMVAAMQCEALAAAPPPPSVPAVAQHDEWYEKLIDLLELYLVRQTGVRRPLAIADGDLRALVSHIRD